MPPPNDPKPSIAGANSQLTQPGLEKLVARQHEFEESLKAVAGGNPAFLSVTLAPGAPDHSGNTVVKPGHGTKLHGSDDGVFVTAPDLGACAIVFQDKAGSHNLRFDGDGAFISLRDGLGKHETVRIDGVGGIIRLKNDAGKPAIVLDRNGQILLRNGKGHPTVTIDGSNGVINLLNDAGVTTVVIDGIKGDITLKNADFAEDFDVADGEDVEPGTVMILDGACTLRASRHAYDHRVAGVVSGAGDYKPGIVLDKQHSNGRRSPIALVGKVYCKAEAHGAPISVGDLLTTSATPGHAMKATNRSEAFGAIIGKALGPLTTGQGLIPILIALQ
jgi:hypothetical protein